MYIVPVCASLDILYRWTITWASIMRTAKRRQTGCRMHVKYDAIRYHGMYLVLLTFGMTALPPVWWLRFGRIQYHIYNRSSQFIAKHSLVVLLFEHTMGSKGITAAAASTVVLSSKCKCYARAGVDEVAEKSWRSPGAMAPCSCRYGRREPSRVISCI